LHSGKCEDPEGGSKISKAELARDDDKKSVVIEERAAENESAEDVKTKGKLF